MATKMTAAEELADAMGPAPATLSIADLIAALKASSGNDDESMRKRAQYEAEAKKLLDEVENKTHPGISVFSNPKGDLLDPKHPLKCRMTWVGYEEHEEVLPPEEIDLMNLAEPGTYPFTRPDGSKDTLSIEGKRKLDGQIESLHFSFPCSTRELRRNVPTRVVQLREAFGLPSELDALKAELARTKALLNV